MDGLVRKLSGLFERCLNQNVTELAAAEKQLKAASEIDGFVPAVINIIALSTDAGVSQAAAIYLKNLVRQRWEAPPESAEAIKTADKTNLRENALQLLKQTRHRRGTHAQVVALVEHVANIDFPTEWPNLLKDAVQLFGDSNDLETRETAVDLVHRTLLKYRSGTRSTDVLRELKFDVLPHVSQPLFLVFVEAVKQLNALAQAGPAALNSQSVVVQAYLKLLHRSVGAFLSLISVDLPEFVEDNCADLVQGMLRVLTIDLPQYEGKHCEDGLIEGPVDELRVEILAFMTAFVQRYTEELLGHVENITEIVLLLLRTKVGPEQSYDGTVTEGLHYLTALAKIKLDSAPYTAERLEIMCREIILPNIRLRDSDLENITDNPQEYLRRSLEIGEADTRRGAVLELVKGLGMFYSDRVYPILVRFASAVLTSPMDVSGAAIQEARLAKDAAVYLMIGVIVKGETRQYGVTKINRVVDLNDFFSSFLAPGLIGLQENDVLLQLAAMKYLATFKNQLSKQLILSVLPRIVNSLSSAVAVISGTAAFTLGQVIQARDMSEALGDETLSTPPGLKFSSSDVQESCAAAVPVLLRLIAGQGALQENEYPMRCLVSVMVTSRASIMAQLPLVMQTLREVVLRQITASNNPIFSHFLFESLALLIRGIADTAPAAAGEAEQWLLQNVEAILQRPDHDFAPYALQLLGLLVDSSASATGSHEKIFVHLVQEKQWTCSGSRVPALVRVFSAFLRKFDLFSGLLRTHLKELIDRMLYCIINRPFTNVSFDFLEAVAHNVPAQELQAYLQPILLTLLQRLNNFPSVKLCQQVTHALGVLSVLYPGPSILPAALDNIQQGLHTNFLKNVFLAHAGTLIPNYERRIALLATAKLCPVIVSETDLLKLAVSTCATLLGLVEEERQSGISTDLIADDFTAGELLSAEEFQGTFNQLQYAKVVKTRQELRGTDVATVTVTVRHMLRCETVAAAAATFEPWQQVINSLL